MARPQNDQLVRVGRDAFELLEGSLGKRRWPTAPPLNYPLEGFQVTRRHSGMVLLVESFRLPPRGGPPASSKPN